MDWVRPLAMADGIQNGEPPARANKPVGVFVAEKAMPLAAPASAAPQVLSFQVAGPSAAPAVEPIGG